MAETNGEQRENIDEVQYESVITYVYKYLNYGQEEYLIEVLEINNV